MPAHILVFKFLVRRQVSLVLIKFHLAVWQEQALPNMLFSSLKIAKYICPQLNQCTWGITALTSVKLHWYGWDQNLTQKLETNLTLRFKMLSVLQFLRFLFPSDPVFDIFIMNHTTHFSTQTSKQGKVIQVTHL